MIAAAVPDLMDRSRFAGVDVRFIECPADAAGADLVVVDLDRCTDTAGFAALPCRTIAFGSHVDADGLVEASEAGFDQVMARSAFFRRLREILGADGAAGRIDPAAG